MFLIKDISVKSQVVYKNCALMKGSVALDLWEKWQADKTPERNKIQKKLDDHMKSIETQSKDLMTRYG